MINNHDGTRLGAYLTAMAKIWKKPRQTAKAICIAVLTLVLCVETGIARTVIDNDPGGPIEQRLDQIRRLRADGGRIEIRGFCASSCTMLIGLPNACVSPGSRLGFHGPSSAIYGLGLAPDQFEYWSRVMAKHYPNQMRSWFMKNARNNIMGLNTISGRDAIKMGARSC